MGSERVAAPVETGLVRATGHHSRIAAGSYAPTPGISSPMHGSLRPPAAAPQQIAWFWGDLLGDDSSESDLDSDLDSRSTHDSDVDAARREAGIVGQLARPPLAGSVLDSLSSRTPSHEQALAGLL